MRVIKLLLLIIVLVAIDQSIKTYLTELNNKDLLTTYRNIGISFSLLPSLPWRSILPVVLFLMLGFLLKSQSLGLSLIIAGGISNLTDRIFRGGVVDFIDLKIMPVFNMADLLISLGSVIMLIELIKQELKSDEETT
jgi:signal peptidase II